MLAGAHARGEQAAHHRVDADLVLAVRVAAVLVHEADVVGRLLRLLIEQERQRDSRVRIQFPDACQTRHLARHRAEHAPHVADRTCDGTGDHATGVDQGLDALALSRRRRFGGRGCGVDFRDVLRLRALALGIPHPVSDERPGVRRRGTSHDQPEMPCVQSTFVDVRARCRAQDPAHRGRRGDLVDIADERQNRRCDVGERDRPSGDAESAPQHPVVNQELLQELGERRAGPRHPAVVHQVAALPFPGQQGIAVV
ncbi:Uncharacterised protein [Mycobacteroides abscessus subsp. abscessus]|nr:Uncharacterised protein [Mycobacteroides abscessus subsp. abscessus]